MGERVYSEVRADYVPSTENHGPYITTEYGTTMCDFYTMSQPNLPSTANGGPSRPILFLDEQADGNAERFVACWNAMTGIPDPAATMKEVREVLGVLIGDVQAWVDAVDNNGTSWDDWDYHYKNFAYNGGLDRARALLAKLGRG